MKKTAYLIQATLISLWWIGILTSQSFYAAFQYPNISEIAFNSFMIPDIIVLAILSVFVAYSKKQQIEYIILGGFAFATLYCINASILTNGGFLPTTIMILGLSYNIFLISGKKLFRESPTDKLLVNFGKTLIQIICIWTITLIVFPILILKGFKTAIPTIAELNKIGLALFVIFSFIGLYSAVEIVRIGKGTPLPMDQTSNLVITGPYKLIRNPMAVAGIGQGISLSIILSSIHILMYSILGAILWQYVVKPMEEKDMIRRFGSEYERYRDSVKCWIPKMKKMPHNKIL